MKNLILMTTLIMVFASGSFAQMAQDLLPLTEIESPTGDLSSENAADLIAVMSVKGKVKYAAPNSRKYKKLKDGAILHKMGKLKVKRKAELQYLKNGTVQSISKKGKYKVSELPSTESEMTPKGDDFLSYLTSASGWAGPVKGAKKDTSKNNSDGHGKARGHNGESLKMMIVSPMAGKWHKGPMVFKWTTNSETGFTLNIYEGDAHENPVFSKETKANKLMIDLSRIKEIKEGVTYYWQVTKDTGVENVLKRTGRTELLIVGKSEAQKELTELESMEDFKTAPDWQQDLRRARVLESSGFYSDAINAYKMAAGKYPSNELVQQAFNMFSDKM